MNKNRGFTIFFATLVASLALAVGLAIYDITVRQINLSTTVVQSQYAIYAADAGAECALYWDAKYTGSGGAFATSSASLPPAPGLVCGSYDVSTIGTPPSPYVPPPSGWNAWIVTASTNAATTTFTMTFPPYSYCARVEVGKSVNGSGIVRTTILAHGYNTCAGNAQDQIERELKASY